MKYKLGHAKFIYSLKCRNRMELQYSTDDCIINAFRNFFFLFSQQRVFSFFICKFKKKNHFEPEGKDCY